MFKKGMQVVIDNWNGATNHTHVGKRAVVVSVRRGEYPVEIKIEGRKDTTNTNPQELRLLEMENV